MRISPERFEQLALAVADEVLEELPPELRAEAETVILETAEQPTAEQCNGEGRLLLGLYEGVPLIDRHVDAALLSPDRITLFRLPLQAAARTEVELRHQIRKTLIHELGHFFGFDEEDLGIRGWG
jgi:predicted Zn-dependent protease with MMP-like domain